MDNEHAAPDELQPWPRGVRKPFRAFCSEQYYVNRDEYFAFGQHQPYTMEQYIRGKPSSAERTLSESRDANRG